MFVRGGGGGIFFMLNHKFDYQEGGDSSNVALSFMQHCMSSRDFLFSRTRYNNKKVKLYNTLP